MIGQGVLRECLLDPGVALVQTIQTDVPGVTDPKLSEIVHADLTSYASIEPRLMGFDACFWCLGVSSTGMSEADYTRITHDYTIAAAKALVRPTMTFIFVSGAGAEGKAMWARVKRKTEVALFAMPFKAVYVFRPGVDSAAPRHQVEDGRILRMLYTITEPLLPVLRRLMPGLILTTEQIGRAMLTAALQGARRACSKAVTSAPSRPPLEIQVRCPRKTMESPTQKLSTPVKAMAAAFAITGCRPTMDTRAAMTARFPASDTAPFAAAKRTNRIIGRLLTWRSPHVHRWCHTKLCTTASATAAQVAGM